MELISRLKNVYWGFRASNLRGIFIKCIHPNLEFPILIRKGCQFKNLKYLNAGRHLVISDHVEIFINPERGKNAKLSFGNNVSIGRYTSIGCANHIIIEDDVTLAPYVHLTDRNHCYADVKIPIWRQPVECPGPIVIGEQSWLGYGVQVMPGVTIGRHCVIAAGSIVTREIPEFCVAAGIPAKVIKQYNFKTQKWESVKNQS